MAELEKALGNIEVRPITAEETWPLRLAVLIGAAFDQAEARIVLGRLLQTHEFQIMKAKVHAHMGATLEPHPGVVMRVMRRQN